MSTKTFYFLAAIFAILYLVQFETASAEHGPRIRRVGGRQFGYRRAYNNQVNLRNSYNKDNKADLSAYNEGEDGDEETDDANLDAKYAHVGQADEVAKVKLPKAEEDSQVEGRARRRGGPRVVRRSKKIKRS